MATQADTLTLAAQVVDQFSTPLRDLTRQLKAFSSLEQTTSIRGKRDVDDHWKSYRDLSKQVTETAASTKKLLTPAVEALGVTSLAAIGSIGGVAAALKSLTGSTKELSYLSKETGQAADQLRLWGAVAERYGAAPGAMAAGFQKFSAALEQAQHNRGEMLNSLRSSQLPLIRDLAEQLRTSTTDAEGYADVMATLPKLTEQGKKQLLEKTFFPPELSRFMPGDLEATAKRIGVLTEDMQKKLIAAQRAMDDLRESVEGLSTAISAKLAPALTAAAEGLSDLISEHPGIAALGASLAGMAASWGILKGGGAVLRGVLGISAGAAGTAGAAGVAGATAAGAAPGIIGSIGGGVAGAARFGLTGLGAWGLYELVKPRPLNEGEDERARQRKYGISRETGRGQRALMERAGHDGFHPISGAISDIAQGLRGEESVYKGTLKGSREGVIQAFQQLFRDRQASGSGGGIVSAAYHPRESGGGGLAGGSGSPGGGIGQDSGPGGVTGAGEPSMGRGAHAARGAILTGHVKEFARSLQSGGHAPHAAAGKGESQEVVDYIRDSAKRLGIDPDIAVRVARSEGLKGFNPATGHWSSGSNDAGTSFGPFQSHFASNIPGFRAAGLGDKFLKQGVDVRKMGNWKKAIDLSLGQAKTHGWRDWHGWRGGAFAGIGQAARASADGVLTGGSGNAAAAASFAESMQGLKDHDAAGHAAITQYLRTGGSGMDPATTKWCGAFVEASLHKAGIAGPAGAAVATNWARWGTHVEPANARRGDVAVVLRGYRPGQLGGHVGLVTGAASGGQIPTIEGDVRSPGGGHMARAASQRIREGLEIRRAPVGLDADVRKRFAPGVVKHEGHAKVSVDFRGMPRGVKATAGKPEGIFKEVRVDRGRAGTIADTG